MTLFDKVWNAHTVKTIDGGRSVLFIDRHYIHEVTSPVAFSGIKNRGLEIFRPSQTIATADHNVPTKNQHLPIEDEESRRQLSMLQENCETHNLTFYGLGHPRQGIVHVVGPELGFTLPGMTIVCGDSHTSTHGAFGSVAFGIGTSEVEMVFASQSILQPKPKTMLIKVDGELNPFVEAKDIILYIISKISASGGTGHFIEFAGSAIESLSMEGRMTLCNMSIECGARGGMIAPDETVFEYVKSRPEAPKGEDWDKALAYWKTLYSESDAKFDTTYIFDAKDIFPQVTYGTNPGMGMAVTATVPTSDNLSGSDKISFSKALEYMGFEEGEKLEGKAVDYIFVGSCTNGRIEDFRKFASIVKGRQKAENVIVWLVPGSKTVEKQAYEEGLVDIFNAAGFEFREPGCSACLAMNSDKIPSGKYCLSTSNRNFEGRQGQGARTLLCGVAVAASAAVTGVITDPAKL
ncbi:MAG: 3-isopropylmalate dehydratase large subunit [Rikenellaceae bacterium]